MTKYVRYLDLSHNNLSTLPEEFCGFGYSLDELHIRHNRLHDLPQNIAQLQVQRSIELNGRGSTSHSTLPSHFKDESLQTGTDK